MLDTKSIRLLIALVPKVLEGISDVVEVSSSFELIATAFTSTLALGIDVDKNKEISGAEDEIDSLDDAKAVDAESLEVEAPYRVVDEIP